MEKQTTTTKTKKTTTAPQVIKVRCVAEGATFYPETEEVIVNEAVDSKWTILALIKDLQGLGTENQTLKSDLEVAKLEITNLKKQIELLTGSNETSDI